MKVSEWRAQTSFQRWSGLHFQKSAQSQAPCEVIALHGWLDNAASFDPLARELMQNRFSSCLALDLPGHGKSAWRKNQLSYVYTDWIALLHNLFVQQKWKKKILIGHSLGASVAAIFANLFPERVEKLILIDAFGPVLENTEEIKARFKKFCLELERVKKVPSQFNDFNKLVHIRSQNKFSTISTHSAHLLMKRGTQAKNKKWLLRSDPSLKLPSSFRLSTAQSHALLQGLACPTLILRNKESARHEYWKAYQKTIQTCSELKISDLEGGHHLHMDNAKKAAQEILNFLGR
jgi:pimeloyl-ACP methyl ester carboxylesterase